MSSLEALMLSDGQGVPQNYIEAVKWYRKAADQGDASAQDNLGTMLHQGRGVLRDDTEAAKWILKAADQGDAKAQGKLGISYEHGEGVPQDYVIRPYVVQLGCVSVNWSGSKELVCLERFTRSQDDCCPDRGSSASGSCVETRSAKGSATIVR